MMMMMVNCNICAANTLKFIEKKTQKQYKISLDKWIFWLTFVCVKYDKKLKDISRLIFFDIESMAR